MPRKVFILAVAVAVVAVVITSVVIVLFLGVTRVETFEQTAELYFYVDEAGNASGHYAAWIPNPKLEGLIKQSIALIGTDKAENVYLEALRNEFARFGVEIRKPVCQITGLGSGENFVLTMTWEMPSLARRNENGWIISLGWVNAQDAARETIAEVESNWVSYRNIARYLGAPDANFNTTTKSYVILPENAENIVCPLLGSSYSIDYGGGTYSRSSVFARRVDGRFGVVDDGQTLTATKNEFTITPEQLIESYPTFTVTYDATCPENLTFINSVSQLRLDLKYGRNLSGQYLVMDKGTEYPLSPAQVLYYAADAIVTKNQGGEFSISQPLVSAASPRGENGEWRAVWGKLSKKGYVSLAQTVRDEIESTHIAPGTVETAIGKLRFRDVLYTFLRILAAYEESEALPHEVLFAPVPTDNLASDSGEIPASHAYYLLGDTFVIEGGDRANVVLGKVRQPDYDNRELARGLYNWVHENISYTLMFSPPTSEEVLYSRQGQCRDYTNVYLALTRTAGIPARRVNGWIVSTWTPPTGIWEIVVGQTPEGKPIVGHAWTQVFIDKEWVAVDPTIGHFESLQYEIYRQVEQTWSGALAGYETAHGVL